MVNLLLEYSRYLMLLIMILYTILNLYALRSLDPAWQNRICRKQMWLTFLLQFLGYGIIYLKTEELEMLQFYTIQVVVFFVYYMLFGLIYRHGSRALISNTIMLVTIGIMEQTRLDVSYAQKQFFYVCIGFVLTLLIPVVIRYMHVLAKWAWFYGILGIALLAVVWRTGNTTLGAQLSISLGPITLQPSEFIKITFVFFTASMLQKSTSFKNVVVTTIVAAIHVLILVASTDLGSALVYFVSYVFMLFVATHQPLYLAAGFGSGGVAGVLAYRLFTHVQTRVKMWQDPFYDYSGGSYQITQCMFAISTGGWLGLGFYQGIPTTIPLARNDAVFAAIWEEFGGIFCICLILTYLGFVLQMIWVSTWMNEMFYKLVGFGLAVLFGFQVFLHVGGVTKMIPMTGITLPLISYGGSSVLSTMIIIGIIQGLHLMKEKEVRELDAERRHEEQRHYEEQQRRREEQRRDEERRQYEERQRRNREDARRSRAGSEPERRTGRRSSEYVEEDGFEIIERGNGSSKKTRQ
ncbi:MAG: FtsW/RodA/SpoVE family cell cycle protein [Lachnospiraceae bacterium]|nr:FtsW/RodA/SpoVE family cell cycle protein [Lachnospiraceae bacterium]